MNIFLHLSNGEVDNISNTLHLYYVDIYDVMCYLWVSYVDPCLHCSLVLSLLMGDARCLKLNAKKVPGPSKLKFIKVKTLKCPRSLKPKMKRFPSLPNPNRRLSFITDVV